MMGKRVVIIGAGIVGVATAIYLQREGYQVTLIDKRGVAEGASYGNAGVLASCSMIPVEETQRAFLMRIDFDIVIVLVINLF